MPRKPAYPMPDFYAWLLSQKLTHVQATRHVWSIGSLLNMHVDLSNLTEVEKAREKMNVSKGLTLKKSLDLYGRFKNNSSIVAIPRRSLNPRSKISDFDYQMSGFLWLIRKYHPQITDFQIRAFDRLKHCSPIRAEGGVISRSLFVPSGDGTPSPVHLEFSITRGHDNYITRVWNDYWTKTILLRDDGDTRLFVSPGEMAISDHTMRYWRTLQARHEEQFTESGSDTTGFACRIS